MVELAAEAEVDVPTEAAPLDVAGGAAGLELVVRAGGGDVAVPAVPPGPLGLLDRLGRLEVVVARLP